MNKKLPLIEVGDEVFAEEGGTLFGAVRKVAEGGQPQITVYIENAGDFTIGLDAVTAVHDHKVILDLSLLDPQAQDAIHRAHASEEFTASEGFLTG